jgi:uncharacterized membrane protein YfcA
VDASWVLVPISLVSSMLTALLGLGGGVLLISLMPGLLPAAAVVPVHGAVQLMSNVSRALFAWRDIRWDLSGAFCAGACVGAAVGSRFVVALPEKLLPVLLGIFVLVVTWAPVGRLRLPGRFVTLGAVQTFVSLFVGAAGPLVSPLLLREGLARDQIVATHATMMTALHALKLVAFAVLGFALGPYLPLLAAMTVSTTLGSWAGTRLRVKIPEARFRQVLKILLTVLALRLILVVGQFD